MTSPHASKKPMSLGAMPSMKETKELEKKVKSLQREQAKQNKVTDYDDLNDLSDDDSYSSSLDGFIVKEPSRHHRRHRDDEDDDDDGSVQDLGESSDEEEDDYSSSTGVSGSIHSDDDDEDEEEQRHTKKRKFEIVPLSEAAIKAGKKPRVHSYLPEVKERCKQADTVDTERAEKLNNKVRLNIEELERVNASVLENLKIVEEATAQLEKKEAARTQDTLFVIDHDKVKRDLEAQESSLKQREQETKKRESELKLAVDAAHQLEHQLVERAKEMETNEATLLKERASLEARILELEKREKALAAVPKPKPQPLVGVTPLDGFLSEMQKSNQNMLSREDMCGIVPANLMCSLAYLGGKQQLKYHSLTNSQFLIAEVTNVESGQLLMRQIVSKQLYNAK